MGKRGSKFYWFVAVSAAVVVTQLIVLCLFILFWHQLAPAEKAMLVSIGRQHFIYIFSAALILLAGLGFILDGIFYVYIQPVSKLTEELTLLQSVNPSHRIKIDGSKDVLKLVKAINEGADRLETLKMDIDRQVEAARAESEREKNILAAILSDLPQGVLVCNPKGQILLYNKTAAHLLGQGNHHCRSEFIATDGGSRFVGLGRSVFYTINRHLVEHSLEEIKQQLKRGEANPTAHFLVGLTGGKMLHVEICPVLNHRREYAGFILLLYSSDMNLGRFPALSSEFSNVFSDVRGGLTTIHRAIETLIQSPGIEDRRQRKLQEIIHDEVLHASQRILQSGVENPHPDGQVWPLRPIAVIDLLEMIGKKSREKLGLALESEWDGSPAWVNADSYPLALAILFLMDRLSEAASVKVFISRHAESHGIVRLDLAWQGKIACFRILQEWSTKPIHVVQESLPVTVQDVLISHDAEICTYPDIGGGGRQCLSMFFPAAAPPAAVRRGMITIITDNRPEFFDFDLFNQPGQIPELDDRHLLDLVYTVFDTETTGLNPRAGDEIISIGAVRIVNNRLLRSEFFDHLVNPRRSIPQDSIEIHGILPEMLADKPTIDRVLPLFHRFAEETILVGHNAAFDMRMLQMKESTTGIRFTNPVLDTLLLSAVVHPLQENHQLEAIAERLGLNVTQRHTALGDSVTAGQIFLKLVRLLDQKGIHTLRQAREASQKTYLARLQF